MRKKKLGKAGPLEGGTVKTLTLAQSGSAKVSIEILTLELHNRADARVAIADQLLPFLRAVLKDGDYCVLTVKRKRLPKG